MKIFPTFRQTLWCSVLVMTWIALLPTPAIAQQPADTKAADAEQNEEEEKEKIRPVVDLGRFSVKDFSPVRNETINLSFHMLLAMDITTNERTLEQLENWKHRLRDQVLISIRLTERIDFLDPSLKKFRRMVKLRTNRLLRANLVDEVFLTEFTFKTK